MSDYSSSKPGLGSVYPTNSIDSDHQRLEPLITPQQLRTRFLAGIPLVSQIKDPSTGRPVVITNDMLQELIDSAVQTLELELNIDIYPVQRQEKYAFDESHYRAYGYLQLNARPVSSIEAVTVTPSSGIDLFKIPNEWIETAYLLKGQLQILPMTGSVIQSAIVPNNSQVSGGSLFFGVLQQRIWIPAYWQVIYTSGFPNSLMPRVLNDLIGAQTAMDVLSQLAVTYARAQAYSLAIDGLSQSVSTPGPQIFALRLQELQEKKHQIIKKLKAKYGRTFFSSHL